MSFHDLPRRPMPPVAPPADGWDEVSRRIRRVRRRRTAKATGLTLVLVGASGAAVLLAQGGSGTDSLQPAATPTVTTPPTPTVSAVPTSPAAPSAPPRTPVLATDLPADGKDVGYATGTQSVGGQTYLTFNRIQFLGARDAKALTGEYPDNDYLIIDANPKLRTVRVSPTVDVEGSIIMNNVEHPGTDRIDYERYDLATWVSMMKSHPPILDGLVWHLTYDATGTVIRMEEQFRP